MRFYKTFSINAMTVMSITLLLFYASSAVTAQQSLNSCGKISLPGEYVLSGNIANFAAAACIEVTSSDVVLDGGGHYIIGNSAVSGSYGVHVNNRSKQLTNVTIKNLNVQNWGYGIYYNSTINNKIENNTLNSSTMHSLYFKSARRSIILKNTVFNSKGAGIFFESSTDNIISGNDIHNNNGSGLFLPSSSNNSISNNNIYNNIGAGIRIYRGDPFSLSYNNTIKGNYIRDNHEGGITVLNSDLTSIDNNTVIWNNGPGIWISDSTNNTIKRNNISNNYAGINVAGSSNNNIIMSNTLSMNENFGIGLEASSNSNLIYNNYLNNTNNYNSNGGSNTWNISITQGTNIIGGQNIGGNFWTHPNGSGFSMRCADVEGDGICDSGYTLAPGNIDHLPLAFSPTPGSRACAVMCHYYKKPVNADFYPNINTSYDRLETYLGILSDRNTPWTNVTEPEIEFWWDPAQLYDNTWDHFGKTTPGYYDAAGYANFMLDDFSPDLLEDGTYAVDTGKRYGTTGFSVNRTVTSDGLVSKNGNYTVTGNVMLYEYTDNLGIGINFDQRDEIKVKLQNWSASGAPGNNTDKNLRWININYGGPSYPAWYNFSVTYYVDKIIPGNITYKPQIWIQRQITKQWNDTAGKAANVSIKGKEFKMNSSFHSDNPVMWTYGEQSLREVDLEEIIEVLDPFAEFSISKDFAVGTDSDKLSSGNYDSNMRYNLNIHNRDDNSGTVMGNITFRAKADNITRAGWEQYAVWNRTSVNWTFPPSFYIGENNGLGTDFNTEHSESKYMNVNVSRWMNRTEFSADGYQLAKFNVTFENKDFEWVWARIEANDRYEVDPSIVEGTFTSDAPGNFNTWDHGVHFDFDKNSIQPGAVYNFSVKVKVDLTGEEAPPIIFKPQFAIGMGTYQNFTYSQGYKVEMPAYMLPDHVSYASASSNISNAWLMKRYDHNIALLEQVSGITGPHANFALSKDFVIKTDGNSLTSGNYNSDVRYNLNIYNRDDNSGTVMGNITFRATADNITHVDWEQYAVWNRTSVKWTFPPSFYIQEDSGIGTSFYTDQSGQSGSKYLSTDVSRWMNRTEFSADGYQLARFNVTFENKDFEWAWMNIEAYDIYGVNASIVPGTFVNENDAPGRYGESEHDIRFEFSGDSIRTGVNYGFSVIIKITPTGRRETPISYKPEFYVGKGLNRGYAYGNGTSVEMPSSMLPENIHHASASTNVSNAWSINQNDAIIAALERDTTPPAIMSKVFFDMARACIPLNSSRTINLTLDSVPSGLSGYNITITLSNASAAEIISVGLPAWAGLRNNSSLPADSVWIKAADVDHNIQDGARNVLLATLTVRGDRTGNVNISPAVISMDDDKGDQVKPGIVESRVEVVVMKPMPGIVSLPTDPDSDCIYEDLNGNGWKDFQDVVLFFNYIEWIQENEHVHCFDLNGNGRIDFDDLVRLFDEI